MVAAAAQPLKEMRRLVTFGCTLDNECMNDFTELKREALARQLRKHVQGEVRFDTTARKLYSTDASIYQIEPLGVVLPRTVEDVLAVVHIAADTQVPLPPPTVATS